MASELAREIAEAIISAVVCHTNENLSWRTEAVNASDDRLVAAIDQLIEARLDRPHELMPDLPSCGRCGERVDVVCSTCGLCVNCTHPKPAVDWFKEGPDGKWHYVESTPR